MEHYRRRTTTDVVFRLRDGDESPVRILQTHASILSVASDRTGVTLAAGDSVGTLTFVRGTDSVRFSLPNAHAGPITSLLFIHGGSTLVTGSLDRVCKIWSVATQKVLNVLPEGGAVHAMIATPDGNTFAVGGAGREISVYQATDFHRIRSMSGHTDTILSLAISQDGTYLAAAGTAGAVFLYNITKGEMTRTIPGTPGPVHSIQFSPDGRRLHAAAGDATVWIHEL